MIYLTQGIVPVIIGAAVVVLVFAVFGKKKGGKPVLKPVAHIQLPNAVIQSTREKQESVTPETVAAIIAAITKFEEDKFPGKELIIRTIRRVPVWEQAALQDKSGGRK